MSIHPTALISPKARVAADVEIGPFCVVGPDVDIGPSCALVRHVTISGRVKLGARNVVHATCVFGGPPQDEQPAAPDARIEIGDDNIFHEAVTVHQPKVPGNPTRIGSHNRLEQGSHVAHDSRLGSHVVLGKLALPAGHVVIDDHVTIGPYAVLHQHVTVGRFVSLEGHSGISEDAPPFLWYSGLGNPPAGVRSEELARRGFPAPTIRALEEAYRKVWHEGLPRHESVLLLEGSPVPEVREMARMLRRSLNGRNGRGSEGSRRG